jgi:hypothetical protein
MTRHHAHAGNHTVMVLAGLVAVVCGFVCWSGLVRLLGGAA